MAEAAPEANEPEVVYHYTSIDTMIKIVKTASIWATSISYLNDTSEMEHYLKLVREWIAVYRQTGALDDELIFDDFLNGSDLGFEDRPFVSSFSKQDDSLPQWRSYCPQGNGVAVGFRVNCLKRSFLEEDNSPKVFVSFRPRLSFRKIDYLDASGVQSLDDDIKAAIGESFRNAAEDRDRNQPSLYFNIATPPSQYFKTIIEGLASFKKHPSFVNEHEYRLLVDGIFWQRRHLEFRTTRSTLVPYVSVGIPLRDSRHPDKPVLRPIQGGRWDFIDRVVIGPTANSALSRAAVSAFFEKNEMQVEVVSSAIPYRDW
jgi:hypothetical protein